MLSAKQTVEKRMKVKIKSFDVDMDVKNNGVEFQVHDNDGTFKGDCYVTKSGVTWCAGRTTREKGVKVSWADFIKWMES
jgi:hypothetical protein